MEIIAHRGHSKLYGDNTLRSFEQAYLIGVDAIEMDVCVTRDGVIVVTHDAVDKSTGVAVHDRDSRPADLRLADVFERFSFSFSLVRPSSAGSPPFVRPSFLLDIKDARATSDVCDRIFRLCRQFSCLQRCVFGSFNESHLRDLCRIEKENGCALKKAYVTANHHADLFASRIDAFGLTHVVVYKFQISREMVSFCRSRGVKVFAYTCNTPGLERFAGSLGCHGIITDTPDMFVPRGRV